MSHSTLASLIDTLLNHMAIAHDLSNDLRGWEGEAIVQFNETCVRIQQRAKELLLHIIEAQAGYTRTRVAVIGNFSAGKSSFINHLLEANVCPVGDGATTAAVTCFVYGDRLRIVHLEGGKQETELTEDQYRRLCRHDQSSGQPGNAETEVKGRKRKREKCRQDQSSGQPGENHGPLEFRYYYPFEGFRNIELADTPGFAANNGGDTETTMRYLHNADVVFYVHDSNTGELRQDALDCLQSIHVGKNSSAQIYLIVNKLDLKSPSAQNRILDALRRQVRSIVADVIPFAVPAPGEPVPELCKDARRRIASLLVDISKKKEQFVRDRVEHEQQQYRELLTNDTTLLLDTIVQLENYCAQQANSVEESLQELKSLLEIAGEKYYEGIEEAAEQLIEEVFGVAASRQSYVFEPYGCIVVYRGSLNHLLAEAVKEAFSHLNRLEQRYNQITGLNTKPSRKGVANRQKREFVRETQDQFWSLLEEMSSTEIEWDDGEAILEDGIDSVGEAREQLQRFEPFISSRFSDIANASFESIVSFWENRISHHEGLTAGKSTAVQVDWLRIREKVETLSSEGAR